MTIVAILLAFGLSHLVKELADFRQRGWLSPFVRWCNDKLSMLPGWPGITSFLIMLAVPLLAVALGSLIFEGLLGRNLGGFLFATLVLLYCFGPRDLDVDVSNVVNADTDAEHDQAAAELAGQDLPEEPDARAGLMTETVFVQALRRWFAIIFWFAVLGVIGAMLYRLADWLVGDRLPLADRQRQRFWRLREVMEWPVAQLMTLGLAIAADFDSVFSAWKQYHNEQGHNLFEGDNGFLKAAARRIVLTGRAAQDGFADQLKGPDSCLRQAMDLVWRVLGVWLTLLALMLLVGWIS